VNNSSSANAIHNNELEESLSGNPLFLDLLVECDRHIHENQNFVNEQEG